MGEEKEIYIVGNGRSLKDFDFNFLKDKEWVGCTLGYRHWREINIFPTHYVNVDGVVLKNNLDDIKDLIINKRCESFLLCASIIKEWTDIQKYDNVTFIQQYKMSPKNPFRNLVDYCSGSTATILGYCLGFNVINLLGMDCNYVEFIPECMKLSDGTLKIIKEPIDNPNYYYPKYQQVGDIYNPPNADRIHMESWFDVRNIFLLFNLLRGERVKLYNWTTPDNLKLADYFESKNIANLI